MRFTPKFQGNNYASLDYTSTALKDCISYNWNCWFRIVASLCFIANALSEIWWWLHNSVSGFGFNRFAFECTLQQHQNRVVHFTGTDQIKVIHVEPLIDLEFVPFSVRVPLFLQFNGVFPPSLVLRFRSILFSFNWCMIVLRPAIDVILSGHHHRHQNQKND